MARRTGWTAVALLGVACGGGETGTAGGGSVGEAGSCNGGEAGTGGSAGGGGAGGVGGSAGAPADGGWVDADAATDPCGVDPGGPQVVASGYADLGPVAVTANGDLYWAAGTGLFRLAKGTATPISVVTTTATAFDALAAENSSALYASSSDGFTGVIASPPPGGPPGVPLILASNLPRVRALAVSGAATTFATERAVGGLVGQSVTALVGTFGATAGDMTDFTSVATDGARAYCIANQACSASLPGQPPSCSPAPTIAVVPLTGGQAMTLATGGNPYALAVGGGFVTWTDKSAGKVFALPTAGGSRVSVGLAQKQPTEIVVDAPYGSKTTRAYWLDVGDASIGWGEVPTPGNVPPLMPVVTVGATPIALAADSCDLYWTDTAGNVKRMRKPR